MASRAGAAKAGPNQGFDPWLIWVTFRRCWPWAVPLGLVLAGISAAFVLQSFVPRYEASHLLEANEDYVVFRGVMPTVKDLARTESPLFYNAIVLDQVLLNTELRKYPSLSDPETAEENLRENLSVSSGGTKERLIVSYEEVDPVAAAEICNEVVAAYLRQRDAFDDTRVSNLQRWLEPEIRRWQQEVEQRQRSVQQLSERTHGFAPNQRVAAMEDQESLSLIAELRSQITDLEVQLAVMDAKQAMSGDENPLDSLAGTSETFVPPTVSVERNAPSATDILNFVANDPKVVEAAGYLDRYSKELIDLEVRDLVRINRGYYQETMAKRDEWKNKLEAAKVRAQSAAAKALNQAAEDDYQRRLAAVEQSIPQLKQEFQREQEEKRRTSEQQVAALNMEKQKAREDLALRIKVLKDQFNQERESLEQFGGASAELQFAQEELAVANDVLNKLRERVAAIRTERRQDGAVRTLAKATPPKAPVEAIPLKKLCAVSFGSFVVPFLLGLVWELKVQRLTDSSLVEKNNGLAPVVGEVAKLPNGNRSGRAKRIFEESVDSLRANLFLAVESKDTRSLAVCSSMSGEGKSSVASQLALSIAKATGETVLLVDADLRCPDQHEIFGIRSGKGLCGVLSGKASFEETVDRSLGNLIHVLPAGRLTCSPHRLISPSSMRAFVDQALESYAYVVIDTAPVLAAGESLAVASSVDATLVCAMRDVSRMESVTRTTRRLEAAGANIAGTVFSGVSSTTYAYRYGDYHYAEAAEVTSS